MAAPVRHTCPDIDKVIKRITSALKYADKGKSITKKHTDEWDYFDCVCDELDGLEYEIEKLRSSNIEEIKEQETVK